VIGISVIRTKQKQKQDQTRVFHGLWQTNLVLLAALSGLTVPGIIQDSTFNP
jgi:hypothetical protein